MLAQLIGSGLERMGETVVSTTAGVSADDPGSAIDATVPRGRGPVVLVGGLATTMPCLRPMTEWISSLGYDVTPVAIGAGLDCAQRSVDALAERVHDAAAAAGEPVQLVGHSRGGQFARAAACRTPADVAGLVTLGTPFDLFPVRLPTLVMVGALVTAGTMGLPGLARGTCLFGACCRGFRSALRRPWPDGLPFTSIYSRTDRLVPAGSSMDPAARQVEVVGTHVGLLTGRDAHRAVATALADGARTGAPGPRWGDPGAASRRRRGRPGRDRPGRDRHSPLEAAAG